MNRKTKVLILSYCAAAVFMTAGAVFTAAGGAEGYRRSQDNEYRRAMAQLVNSVSRVDTALEQGRFAVGSGMTGQLCAELMSAARSASTALSILPLETHALEELAGFLSQLEEYARVKGDAACMGKGFSDADRETAAALQAVTGELVPVLGDLYRHLAEGGLSVRGLMPRNGIVTDEADTYLEEEILALLEEFPESPNLIYDGRLSADYDDSPKGIAGLERVSMETALDTAAALAGAKQQLSYMGSSGGALPCYYFGASGEQGSLTVSVSHSGGLPVLYLLDYVPDLPRLSAEEAEAAALDFAARAGYADLAVDSSVTAGGLQKLRLVYSDGSALHTDDGIDIAVALDTGGVVSMDASDYLHNHQAPGENEQPALTEAEAAALAVPKELEIRSRKLTWYTGDTGTTSLCWQFVCQSEDGTVCTIYAAADTGQQISIRTENMSDM